MLVKIGNSAPSIKLMFIKKTLLICIFRSNRSSDTTDTTLDWICFFCGHYYRIILFSCIKQIKPKKVRNVNMLQQKMKNICLWKATGVCPGVHCIDGPDRGRRCPLCTTVCCIQNCILCTYLYFVQKTVFCAHCCILCTKLYFVHTVIFKTHMAVFHTKNNRILCTTQYFVHTTVFFYI